MKTIKGDLIMEEDMNFDEDLKVEGHIFGKGGEKFNLKVNGDLKCWNLNFLGVAVAYNSFKCKSWKARRHNFVMKCLDGKIIVDGEEVKKE